MRVLPALLAACSSGSADRGGAPPAVDVVPASLSLGEPVACADPALRAAAGPWEADDKQSAPQPVDGAWLHGGGALVEDLDGDGWVDLFLPAEATGHQLFWGLAGDVDDLFLDARDTLAGLPLSMAVGATAADHDGDGDLDVLVTRWLEPLTLLRNEGNRTFTDVSALAFGPDAPALRAQSSSWGDFDADGDLDLFVGTYGEWTELDVLDPAPDCSDHLADPKILWRNEGDGTFSDASHLLPPEVQVGYTFMSGWYDLDLDGFPELFTAHDDGLCGPSVLLDNLGGEAFVVDHGSGFHPNSHDMGMAVGDLNGDLLPDVVTTSWNGVYYVESDLGADGVVRWFNAAATRGITVDAAPQDNPAAAQPGDQVYGWGAEFGDVDNDADLDLAMVFGYWSTYDGAGDPLTQRDGLWIQDGGSFTDQGTIWGLAHDGASRSVVLADIDGDGWLDVLKRVLGEPSPLLISRCGDAGWLKVRLRASGPNTHAVGARVRVVTASGEQVRWIQSGSAGMYGGGPLEAHFGLGAADTVEFLEVVWPDGTRSGFRDVPTRRVVTVERR